MDAPLMGLDAEQDMGSSLQQLPVYGTPVYGSPYARHRGASRAEQEAAAENASDLQSEELAGELQQVLAQHLTVSSSSCISGKPIP